MFFKSYPYHVYIVRCCDGSFYTGITNDLERRLQQHNGERWGGARYTRGRGPVELIYIKKYETRSEAAKFEYQIKHKLNHEQKQDLINNISKEDILKAI
ncbi:MAG TPA: GIY-YIG nuclease family protein [Candidatus Paceibacterota bacterium]|jgi:putative endonuclease|nr:GIY-YIG nuclease family protein [Candidatus Paceibacterota bacterium]